MSARKKRGWLVFLILATVMGCCVTLGIFSTIQRQRQGTPTRTARVSARTRAPTRTPRPPTATPAVVLSLMDALNQERISVQTEGAGLSAVRIVAERLEPVSLKILIPVGTYFVNRGSGQNMVSVQQTTLYLTEDEPVKITVPSACANLLLAVPGAESSFDIVAWPEQEELQRLVAAIEKGKYTPVVKQVAVWIVTDDVSRPKLDGRYVLRSSLVPFGGSPAASDEDVIQAMWLASEAGIPIGQKKIFTEELSLVRALASSDSAVSGYACEALGVAQEETFAYLVSSLQGGSPGVRWAAAYALGKLGDQRAVEPLRKALYDDHDKVRREAVKSLGQLKAVEALIDALGNPDDTIRNLAVHALDDLKDPRAVEPLIAALGDEDSSIRQVACYAVRDLGDVRAVQPLIERLRDSNKFVRQCAAEALGKIGDPRAIEPLEARLETEEDEQVRNSIKRALRSLGS